ncbi:Glutamine dumper 1 [Heracleum sosnowskyi]|uniref:Glutamine dumper 1 n=1 Tax=Heracleum sosnowskyi TaxID=360622 RepID=A0AAD8HBH9_9APIA|nr:Glutamine dumper 1 [Heracleum sosnowskyi]
MRPILATIHTTSTGTTVVAAGVHRWNSPLPYLFGGLALMLTLIALALIILACSFKKSMMNSTSENDVEEDNLSKPAGHVTELEMEPRIVVIMAGDEVPTFLLKKS